MVNKVDLINALTDKDDKKAYNFTKIIMTESASSEEYYPYFEDFRDLLIAQSSYVRTRGFVFCCAQARWDREGKIDSAFSSMVPLIQKDVNELLNIID